MLPHGSNSASIQKVRQVSASLSDQDDGFKSLRAKIHGTPGAEDAASVRQYAAGLATDTRRKPYLELADEIDAIYQAEALDQELDSMAARYTAAPWLQKVLTESATALRSTDIADEKFIITGQLLADLRTALPRIKSSYVRLEILDLSLRVEVVNYSAASVLRSSLNSATRKQRTVFLKSAGRAAFGTGVINARLLAEMEKTLSALAVDELRLDRYLGDLNYLGRAPGWGTQALRMQFYEAME